MITKFKLVITIKVRVFTADLFRPDSEAVISDEQFTLRRSADVRAY
jgi:hypothetical protein